MARLPNERSDSDTRDDGGIPSRPTTADNRLVNRRDPSRESPSGLVSRDYQPRTGGPELIASWPLGTPPTQTGLGDDDWEVLSDEFVTLQRNLTVTNFLGPLEYTKLYGGVRGRVRVDPGATLYLRFGPIHLEGEQYVTTVRFTCSETAPFITPMVEFTPDARDYREHSFIGREMYGGYELEARVEDGHGYLDQGTAVHLWSE